uniref:Uncharacterized protein n=1 Tax=Romanomermis culicivorax TaxID=13658 RepID=A0A915HJN7_ROMCU
MNVNGSCATSPSPTSAHYKSIDIDASTWHSEDEQNTNKNFAERSRIPAEMISKRMRLSLILHTKRRKKKLLEASQDSSPMGKSIAVSGSITPASSNSRIELLHKSDGAEREKHGQ